MSEVIEAAPALELAPVPERELVASPTSTALAEQSPAGIMLAALGRGVSIADMRETLALQREWHADQARAAFYEALAAFKAKPLTIIKRKGVGYEAKTTGEWVGYKHAELSDVVAAVDPALSSVGLSYRWDVKQAKDWITVACILSHRLGHSERVEMGGPPDASGKKNAIQQIASTTTYLQRYTLKAITGVAEAGEDDDGQGGAEGDAPQPQQAAGKPDPKAAMCAAGQAAAAKGMDALTAWWKGLSSKDQAALGKEFTDMRKTARRADQEKSNG